MANNTPIVLHCPDCGRAFPKRHVFYHPGTELHAEAACRKCVRKKGSQGIHFRFHTETTSALRNQEIFYTTVSSSGIEGVWAKRHVWCPVCRTPQCAISSHEARQDIRCNNSACPTIGFSYEYNGSMAIVSASGVQNDVLNFYAE